MNNFWYEKADFDSSLTQGDLIMNCPVVGWQTEELPIDEKGENEALKGCH